MNQFLLGALCTSIAWIVGLAWKDARIPQAVLRLYAVSVMTTGFTLAIMGLIPIVFGAGNEAVTRDIAALTVQSWPWWLVGIGAALAAMPVAAYNILRIVGRVRQEAEKERQAPPP